MMIIIKTHSCALVLSCRKVCEIVFESVQLVYWLLNKIEDYSVEHCSLATLGLIPNFGFDLDWKQVQGRCVVTDISTSKQKVNEKEVGVK